MIIYSKTSELTPAAIGRLDTPLKMIIEHESDIQKKKGGVADLLFNIEKSNRFGETLVIGREFDVFQHSNEGEAAVQDTITEARTKFIEHVQFMKEFVISAEMMEDANYGVAADAKRRAEAFIRAYYKTMNKLCETALINGMNESVTFAGSTIDLTTPDGLPLFHYGHKFYKAGIQPNYFYGDIFSVEEEGGNRVCSLPLIEESLYRLSVKMRNMRDENGEPLGYTADTIILPGNRPFFEAAIKKVCGSENTMANNNSINLNCGNWNVIVLPGWSSSDDMLIMMSSEANKNLGGNMLFNRVPLTVTNWVDHHTGNYVWNGRCRFGVGFGTYKHVILAHDTRTEVENGIDFN